MLAPLRARCENLPRSNVEPEKAVCTPAPGDDSGHYGARLFLIAKSQRSDTRNNAPNRCERARNNHSGQRGCWVEGSPWKNKAWGGGKPSQSLGFVRFVENDALLFHNLPSAAAYSMFPASDLAPGLALGTQSKARLNP